MNKNCNQNTINYEEDTQQCTHFVEECGEYGLEEVACLLQEDDIQCGHIFYSEKTRVLKFFCTYCNETYDNINYYCEHLGEHINGANGNSNGDDMGMDDEQRLGIEEMHPLHLANSVAELTNLSYQPTEGGYENVCETVEQYDEEVTVGEESVTDLDEAEEIAAEVEEEMRQTYTEEDILYTEENSCADEQEVYTEQQSTTDILVQSQQPLSVGNGYVEQQLNADFESMIDATTLNDEMPKILSLSPNKKKQRKVTTVKVIAIKNRIAELYERIKTEEEKRSKLLELENNYEKMLPISQSQSTLANNANHEQVEQESISTTSLSAPVHHKIIGETLITLLPAQSNGQCLANSAQPLSQLSATTFSESIKQHRRESVCPACGLCFRNPFSLSIHKRTHYLESKSAIKLAHKCSDCDQLFNRISELKEHLQQVHYPDGFICKICGKKLTSLTLLEKHMRAVHLNRPFSCKICQKSFDSRNGFEAHVDTHIEGQSNFKCRVCGRKYSTEASLQHHLRNHKEQKPQCCVVCGKMTLRITQHMKIHTPRPKRTLSCSACGKVFNFSSALSHHFKVMHKLPRPPPKLKKETSSNSCNSVKRKRKIRNATEEKDLLEESGCQSQQHVEHAEYAQQDQLRQQQLLEKQHFQLVVDAEVHAKEEEAKRVIVELIQNASYSAATAGSSTTFLPHTQLSEFEVTAPPPIAREETISAVNSIVNDC